MVASLFFEAAPSCGSNMAAIEAGVRICGADGETRLRNNFAKSGAEQKQPPPPESSVTKRSRNCWFWLFITGALGAVVLPNRGWVGPSRRAMSTTLL